MISNQQLIRDNVLKSTLTEQILKVTSVINYAPVVYNRINQLTQQIAIQENVLQQLKQKHFLRQQQMTRQKQSLKQQLRGKMFLKMTQQQALSGQIKILQQNCHFIRENKLRMTQINAKSNRLANQLEQLEIHDKQAQQEIEKLQLKQIYDKKVQAQQGQTVKQLLMLIQAKRNHITKEEKLMTIVNDQIDDKQSKVRALKQETDDIHVSIARMLPSLEALTNETTKLQTQLNTTQNQLSNIRTKTQTITLKLNQHTIKLSQNTHKSTEITSTITSLIQQSNQLNEKLIKTREHVIQMNRLKNHHKKINQQLKLKLRELMKIMIDNQSVHN